MSQTQLHTNSRTGTSAAQAVRGLKPNPQIDNQAGQQFLTKSINIGRFPFKYL